MLSKLEVRNVKGYTLELPLTSYPEGYMIKDIEGLDPVKATLSSSSFANMDYEQYHSAHREKRNIIIHIELKHEHTTSSVRQLRTRLYEYLMPKSNVRLRFHVDGLGAVDIYGRVESFETQHFAAVPSVAISLLCFDSDFYNADPVTIAGMTTPWDTELDFDYNGTVETGYILRLDVDRDLSSFSIHQRMGGVSTPTTLRFEGVSMIANDDIKLTSIRGQKSVMRERGGGWSSVLYGVTPASVWPIIYPGMNHLRIVSGGAPISYTVEYIKKYGAL